MAFQGHPILADIRKGFKLRPTVTVDKSQAIIYAEGEEAPQIKFEEPKNKPPVDIAALCGPRTERPKVTSTCRVPTDALNIRPRGAAAEQNGGPPPPPGAPAPPRAPVGKPITNPKLLALGKGSGNADRGALLNAIKGGMQLRKTVTVDKSQAVIYAEGEEAPQIKFDESKNQSIGWTPKAEAQSNGDVRHSTPPRTSTVRRSPPAKARSPPRPAVVKAPVKPFVPTGNIPPPPPPPPPMGAGKIPACPPLPSTRAPGASGAPPPPPPPPPMSSSSMRPMARPAPTQDAPPTYRPPPRPRTPSPPKKSDAVFEPLFVSKEQLEKEIPKGSAAARIALLKQMEQQSNGNAFVPKPAAQPGRLKIIETTPPDAPKSNGRLKIHDGETTAKPVEKPTAKPTVSATVENGKPKSSISAAAKKFDVPITVKTDDEPAAPKKKAVRKVSKAGEKKTTTATTTAKKSTLSPETAHEPSLSPGSTARSSSAYGSAASSPNSVSSLSPKSAKSSGVSTASSVSPSPIRTSEGAAERFAALRKSLDERVAAANAEVETGAKFWKSAALKSNGTTTTDSKPAGQPVQIKMPWKAKTAAAAEATKTPPAVPPKKKTPLLG
ncbi:hypothetical protein M3Y99_01321100 [Aphelenchoides fujianensis]|nr:hypothetical protein M3Y99_01321100 [Aphelenchoides fujianensis]